MTSNQIVEAVENYVRDESTKYALLIDGVWGSGKTYLYENTHPFIITIYINGSVIRRTLRDISY